MASFGSSSERMRSISPSVRRSWSLSTTHLPVVQRARPRPGNAGSMTPPVTTGSLDRVVVLAGLAEPQLGNRLQQTDRDVRVTGLTAAVGTDVHAQQSDLDVVQRDRGSGGHLFGHLPQRVVTG